MNRSFTIIVLLIAALAAYVLWPRTTGGFNRKIATAEGDIANLTTALGNFQRDCARFPTTAEGLEALMKRPATIPEGGNWHGPYCETDNLPTDPWGFSYNYRRPGRHNPDSYDVSSVGPDGLPDTPDDIGNWPPPIGQ